ncbi:nitrogen fixation protein NifR [Halobacteriovorax marinus]|uniref:tRNA-dihydrouridine synthase n=1 Tax=Halobacteriovorax marinus TaxID=97084 RepID=A0A1Y5F3Z4_9BACT|nr:nitrogen fixation protein NifR [Halobacteriovorax marinus]
MSFSKYANFPFMMAPMVGLSHVGMRQMLRRYLPKGAQTIWPTEMLNSRRLLHQTPGETNETFRAENETDLHPQILGNEERFIANSLERLEAWGIKGIDINMGCPVSKALRHNYGVSLMGDIEYAREVVRMTTRHTNLPVSVKLRAADQGNKDFLLEFVNALVEGGASWVCLHPREAKQKRKGEADWEQIKFLKDNVDIPVIGNGDIHTYQDALRMMSETGCDGVMIGRALTAKPWILWQIGHALGFENPEGLIGPPPQTPEEEAQEYGRALFHFAEETQKYFDEKQAMKRIKFFVIVGHVWLNFGHSLMSKVHKAKNVEAMKETILNFFTASGLKMAERTELRY